MTASSGTDNKGSYSSSLKVILDTLRNGVPCLKKRKKRWQFWQILNPAYLIYWEKLYSIIHKRGDSGKSRNMNFFFTIHSDSQLTITNLVMSFSNPRNWNIYFDDTATFTKPSVGNEKHDLTPLPKESGFIQRLLYKDYPSLNHFNHWLIILINLIFNNLKLYSLLFIIIF